MLGTVKTRSATTISSISTSSFKFLKDLSASAASTRCSCTDFLNKSSIETVPEHFVPACTLKPFAFIKHSLTAHRHAQDDDKHESVPVTSASGSVLHGKSADGLNTGTSLSLNQQHQHNQQHHPQKQLSLPPLHHQLTPAPLPHKLEDDEPSGNDSWLSPPVKQFTFQSHPRDQANTSGNCFSSPSPNEGYSSPEDEEDEEDEEEEMDSNIDYSTLLRENEQFARYYKKKMLGKQRAEAEKEAILKQLLPTSPRTVVSNHSPAKADDCDDAHAHRPITPAPAKGKGV